MNEWERKREALHKLIQQKNLDAVLLRRVSSFAWATGGVASHINTADTNGIASLLVFPDRALLLTNNIEAPRLEKEDHLSEQGWEFHVQKWHETRDLAAELTEGKRLGSDGPYPGAKDLSLEFTRLRSRLLPEEQERFKILGKACGEAVEQTVKHIRPGQMEWQIAATLASQCEQRGIQAIVNLVAVDDRIFSYRHFLPTAKQVERYAMVVLCGRRGGLVAALTRLVYFGKLPDDVQRKAHAVAGVDAAIISATRPGGTFGDAFDHICDAYTKEGFPAEWQNHHQGGSIAYEPREFLAVPGSAETIYHGQAFAWNPSITGTKSEDTILVGERANEIITATGDWPILSVGINGQTINRPAILERT